MGKKKKFLGVKVEVSITHKTPFNALLEQMKQTINADGVLQEDRAVCTMPAYLLRFFEFLALKHESSVEAEIKEALKRYMDWLEE